MQESLFDHKVPCSQCNIAAPVFVLLHALTHVPCVTGSPLWINGSMQCSSYSNREQLQIVCCFKFASVSIEDRVEFPYKSIFWAMHGVGY